LQRVKWIKQNEKKSSIFEVDFYKNKSNLNPIFMSKKIINTPDAPNAIGPYSQAIKAGNTLYISGQIPINPDNGKIEATTIKEQTEQVMKNVGAILKAAGYDYEHVVKSTCLLSDISNFAAMNEVYGKYYDQSPPARAAFAVKDLPLGALVEIETIAFKD
jgi:2-iminobutanoate/2-iminopropanoate deaminase